MQECHPEVIRWSPAILLGTSFPTGTSHDSCDISHPSPHFYCIFFFKICFIFSYVYGYVHTHVGTHGGQKVSEPLELGFQAAPDVLGSGLGTYGRAVCALTC